MAEVLSQSQIDALLASVVAGGGVEETRPENEEKKYRNYDFYSPKKFTKDKLNILKTSYESYSRIASSRINSLLRITSEVDLATVEEERYYEFSNALTDTDTLTVINAKFPDSDEVTPIYMHISAPMMLNMIDRMLGGTGEDNKDSYSGYTYTDIELSLYENIVKYLVEIMGDAWSNYLEVDFEVFKFETSSGLLQEIRMDEIVVIVVLEIEISGTTGMINICIPATLLSSMFTVIESKKAPHGKLVGNEDKTAQQIFQFIKSSTLDVTAKIGDASLSLKDVYNLREGDIINMSKPKNSDVDVFVDENFWFKGRLGVHDKNIAVKISDVCKKL